MATGAIVARILTQYSDKGSKSAQKDIKKLGADFDKFAKRSFKAFGIATLAVGAFATKLGVDAVKGAMEDQKQQIALATALRNTTGATDEAIAATVSYLDKLELLVGVDNNQLIPSLQILTQATKDVTQAQQLQALALDISAGTSKDLGAVSLALAKALGGNVGALTRLGVPLDAAQVKARDLNGILQSLADTFEGQAAKRAQTLEFRLMSLQLAFNQVLDQLGYAFIPVLEELAQNLLTNVIPAVQKFVDENKEGLVAGLRDATKVLQTLLERSIEFGLWISNNTDKVKAIGILIATMFVANKAAAFIISLKAIASALVLIRNSAMAAGIATAFATAGVSVATAATALAAVGVTALVTKRYMDGTAKSTDKVTKSTKSATATSKAYTNQFKGIEFAVAKFNKTTTQTTATTKALTAEQKKAIEVQKKLKAQFGVVTKEDDPIQLEAARLNLLKQQALGIEALTQSQYAFIEAQFASNVTAQRYADILVVINDNKISSVEVDTLALKWGKSREFVIKYIESVTGINNIVIGKDLGLDAAKSWENAKKKLDEYLKRLEQSGQVSPSAQMAVSQANVAVADIEAAIKAAEDAIKAADDANRAADEFIAKLGLTSPSGVPLGQPFSPGFSAGGNNTPGTSFGSAPTSGFIPGFSPTTSFGSSSSAGSRGFIGPTINVNVNTPSLIGSADALVEVARQGILAAQSSGNIISYNPLDI